jgi:hypothetical protein
MTKAPMRVAVSGAAGQIGYALLFRIANGDMLGKAYSCWKFPMKKHKKP